MGAAMTSPPDPTLQERMLGLAVAKGWLRAEQVAGRSLRELVAEGTLLPIQVEALAAEMRTGRAEISGPMATGDEATDLGTWQAGPGAASPPQPQSRHPSSIFKASWIQYWAHFENLVLLAEGGMGRVFKARDMRLGRKVALKLLRREDAELERRLVQEAELQARVAHPHVCTIYESGYWNGQAYIAMELVEGETFAEMKGEWDLPTKLALMAQACEGVHAAHRQGLVHRDLKPANLMAVREEDGWRAVVMDFGLARPAQGSGLTQTGVVMGTVAYMSPEQAKGQDWKLDRRTDVYALGATLYELVGGRTPFHGSAGLEAVSRILSEEPAPLPSVSRDLNTVILKCLEKEPIQRYDSARALGDELLRILEGDPILARPLPWRERMLRRARKNRTLVIVGALGLAASLTLGGFAVRERLVASRRAEFAQRFGQEAERIEALARYLRLQPPRNQEPDWAKARQRLEDLSRAVAEASREGAAPGAYALGRASLALGDPDAAMRQLEQAWSMGYRAPEVSLALGQTFTVLYERDLAKAGQTSDPALKAARLKEALTRFGEPAAAFLRAGTAASLEPRGFHLARLAQVEGRADEALQEARKALEAAPWHYETLALMARAWLLKARVGPAEEAPAHLVEAGRALDRAREMARSDRTLLDLVCQRWQEAISLGWRISADPRESVEAQVAAARDWRVLEPEAHTPWIWEARACGEEARFLAYQGRDATAWLQRALAAAERAYQARPKDPDACAALVSVLRTRGLVAALTRKGDPEPDLRRGLDVARQGLAADPESIFLWNLRTACASVLTSYLIDVQRGATADFLDELIADARRAAIAHPQLAYYHANLGTLLLASAELALAKGWNPAAAATEARAANERAASLDSGHLGIRRGILLALAHQARGALARGEDPAPLAHSAEMALMAARSAGLSAVELEVPVLDAQLSRLAFRGSWGSLDSRELQKVRARLRAIPAYPIAPAYLADQRRRADSLILGRTAR